MALLTGTFNRQSGNLGSFGWNTLEKTGLTTSERSFHFRSLRAITRQRSQHKWRNNSTYFMFIMQLVIRRYRPADKDTVLTLFTTCSWEHIRPCFRNAMTSPLYLTITLALAVVGYLLGSVFGAVLFTAAWVGFIYCCCHEVYSRYIRERLRTDMQDIPGNFLSRSDDCFWVAEAEVEGRPQVIGMVAVTAKHSGTEKYGEMFRMIIAPQCRRMGLGSRLAQTAVDFCKEKGFSKVVLETTSTQMAAVALYSKLGFTHVVSHINKLGIHWIFLLARVTIIRMEKYL